MEGSAAGETMKLRVLSRDHVREAIPMEEAIDAMREAFGQLSAYQADIPLRTPVSGDGGVVLFMPGRLKKTGAMGAKVVSVFEENSERGLPAVNALVLMVDPGTGRPRVLVEGSYLTALRTGAASGLATELLARDDASVLTIFGAGVQARTQVEAVRAVRPIEAVRIVSRTRASAEAFAEELEEGDGDLEVQVREDRSEALAGAHVVCTATTSSEPVFSGDDVEPGTHVNGVGSYTSSMREVDDAFVARARIVVDSVDAAMSEAGDIIGPIRRNVISRTQIHGELGEIVNGEKDRRRDAEEVTFFKSVGNAAQDLAVGRRLMERAEEEDLGTEVTL